MKTFNFERTIKLKVCRFIPRLKSFGCTHCGGLLGRVAKLTKAYHKQLVKEALERGEKVPEHVLEDYPDLVGKEYDIEHYKRQIDKNIMHYHFLPVDIKKNPEIKNHFDKRYVELLVEEYRNEPHKYQWCPEEYKNIPEIQQAYQEGKINYDKKYISLLAEAIRNDPCQLPLPKGRGL